MNRMPFCWLDFICLSNRFAALSQSRPYITIETRTEHNSARAESRREPRHSFMKMVFLDY